MFSEITFVDIEEKQEYNQFIEQVVDTCFYQEHLEKTKLYLSIILTNPTHIKQTNKKYRGIDQETDVLSFPMFEKEELEKMTKQKEQQSEVLGDIMISIPRVEEQAKEYGHSFERELAYMVVHGFYHIMGYDHMKEDEKKIMREKEETILKQLNITRN